MKELAKIEQIIIDLQQDFDAIAMPRSAYVLEHLVVKERDTEPEQWAQCVLEMRVKYIGIKRTLLQQERIRLEMDSLGDDGLEGIDKKLKGIDLEESEWTLTGQLREFFALYQIYQSFGRHYSRAEIEAAQSEYWYKRLTRQASQDVLASGRISVGNQDALRQIKTVARVDDNELRFYQIGNGKELDEPT